MNKSKMVQNALGLIDRFCLVNNFQKPDIKVGDVLSESPYGACGEYKSRIHSIVVNPKKCAHIGRGGPAWSYPGYVIDRTPYGVLCHEFGHAVDWVTSKYKLGHRLYNEVGESQVTNYSPNKGEYFAEHFRLFMTNPYYYKAFRPGSYEFMSNLFKSVETRSSEEILEDAPDRTKIMAIVKLDRSLIKHRQEEKWV